MPGGSERKRGRLLNAEDFDHGRRDLLARLEAWCRERDSAESMARYRSTWVWRIVHAEPLVEMALAEGRAYVREGRRPIITCRGGWMTAAFRESFDARQGEGSAVR